MPVRAGDHAEHGAGGGKLSKNRSRRESIPYDCYYYQLTHIGLVSTPGTFPCALMRPGCLILDDSAAELFEDLLEQLRGEQGGIYT